MGRNIKDANQTYRNKEWLKEQMEIHGSGEKISKSIGVAATTVQRWLKKHSIKNGSINQDKNALYKNKDWLISQYKKGKSVKQVAEEQNVADRSVTRYNKIFNIDIKKIQEDLKYPYKNKEWLKKQVELYGSGLEIARQNNLPPTSVNRYITKYGLIERKYETKTKASLNVDYFESIDAEEKAYWLGFIMADGNIYHNTSGIGSKYTMSIKLKATDLEHLIKFKESIEFSGDIKTRESFREKKLTRSAVIRVNNIKFCEDLIKLDVIPRKSGKERISSYVPDHLVRHFIRGFFDGDGHVNSAPQVVLCTTDEIHDQIKSAITDAGVNNIKEYNRGKIKLISLFRKDNTYNFLKYIYEDATIFLERKFEIANKIISDYESAI